ncbi:Eco57I restriction-modification methylase domain-containing protein [Kaistella palustris]|uniref:Eco57I restriction-modification methylase domain-containing protein n=1 Tax=Kaistella palustris TaxID=493376 RepID=UPI00040C50B1|nr:DNA methyltransferase [Kaistella palustris]
MFQKTIISKYLKTQNKENLIQQWDLFCAHFHNPEIQENIRNSKEEQYQEGFLRDLFVKIFGYTLNPTIGFNLTTEYKNIKDSKKADGAIIIDENVVGVIELKGTNTTDLGKVEEQAFNYKNNQTGCKYVITSNFEKLRLYIDDSVRFVEFNLFTLQQDDFNLLYLLLSFDNIKNDIPKKLKDESLNQEDIVTKKLYKDYSVFKRELFQNLTLLNPEYDPLLLFQKSQKLLDRFLFLLFGEDRGLLPPNSVRQILEQWDKLKDLDAYDPLYNRYKKYFGYLNTGFKGKNHDVFAYNGGLFKEDEILDQIKIDDDLLYQHTFRLSQYDFASEVDVNILGHIFENSLNEIDEIKAQLEGTEIDKSKTKRKKDGVFYTPKYITKYIVENTVGKLCEEKKTEFQIVEEEYFTDKKRQQKTKENLLSKLDQYRNWLLQITIVDPACGSGAFLNEALNFLIEEHQYVDELEAKLLNVPIIFSYHSERILEHNLFGVDLNEESVEIAKLSLWLRTAEPNRKLNSLNDNIKCGNSLINDPEVAGDKAFNWEKEFPQVFEKGGFDVVIGNPPYVRVQNLDYSVIDWLKSNMSSAFKRVDISILFIEQSLKLINERGVISFITSNQFFKAEYGRKIRELIHGKLKRNLDLSKVTVFEGLSTYVSILNFSKSNSLIFEYKEVENTDSVVNEIKWDKFCYSDYTDEPWEFSRDRPLKDKIYKDSQLLENVADFTYGIITGNDNSFILSAEEVKNHEIENDIIFPFVKPENYKRYCIENIDKYIIYPYDSENNILLENEVKSKYPNAYSYLHKNKEILENRKDSRTTIKEKGIEWYSIMRRVPPNEIRKKKLIFFDVGNHPNFIYDNQSLSFGGGTSHSIYFENEQKIRFILGVLNSKLLSWIIKDVCPIKMGDARKYGLSYMRRLPIKFYSKNIEDLITPLVEKIINLKEELNSKETKFQRNLKREFSLEILPKKLQSWYHLSYDEFLKELKKQKVELSLSQKADWEQYFDQEKNKAIQIQSQITSTDQEIDRMVYELYGLSEEEIKIVENS